MITSAQLRAARALLDWSRVACGQALGLSPETIKNIEMETFVPTDITVDKIVKGFALHGVEFSCQYIVALKSTTIQIPQDVGNSRPNRDKEQDDMV